MDRALLIQLLSSVVAVGLLVGVAAWARIARSTPPLDAHEAQTLLAVEFPDDPVDALWIAADGAGLAARSGERVLVVWRRGDDYVARDLPWAAALTARPVNGLLTLKAADGVARLALRDGESWPPPQLVSGEDAG